MGLRGLQLGSMAKSAEQENKSDSPRHIFVTGGVVSSLGKGLTASSLGMLLKARGVTVAMQKLDPYINVDPGTMNPFQHGEVFVTEDGAETDLDIGHYERFLDEPLSGGANVTTGQVYASVIARERRGEYLGDTVQVIPHITDEIMRRMRAQAHPTDGSPVPDVIITEIGGTVGDIESTPFLEAARQIHAELGRDRCLFIHVSLLAYLKVANELKTKPTQHSVTALRGLGIQPDVLVLRSEIEVPDSVRRKISVMCGVARDAVVICPDAKSLYLVPKILHSEGLDTLVAERLHLKLEEADWSAWDELLARVTEPQHSVEVAIVGKYIDLPDAYLSVIEALRAGGFANNARVSIRWVAADTCADDGQAAQALEGVDAVVVPGGFGVRGIEGKIAALKWARENRVPTLGLCLGMQSMVIEAAQNLAGLPGASSTEFDPNCADPVITTMASQEEIVSGEGDVGGTMRLGAFPAVLEPESLVARTYGATSVSERHRHRYEVNPAYRQILSDVGLKVSGTSPDGELVEFVELDQSLHPYYVATQAHPEFKSRPTKPHPLFAGLIGAALEARG